MGGGQSRKYHFLRGLNVDEHPNQHNTSIDNITYENIITEYVFVPSNIHPQNNPHISSELLSFPLQVVI